ncbi:hypothetical protein SKAU_G00214690 [Synaphobranchus kaupii]|uniref:Uncharacterized protein n=1 Tax=Synaphobranchus kaupii TaxID=118154 RepID=A0A9Q1F9V0_SYNKA|nr:hypothetical protein SKAU_G00214690 [Synaphobranchus kaupii]
MSNPINDVSLETRSKSSEGGPSRECSQLRSLEGNRCLPSGKTDGLLAGARRPPVRTGPLRAQPLNNVHHVHHTSVTLKAPADAGCLTVRTFIFSRLRARLHAPMAALDQLTWARGTTAPLAFRARIKQTSVWTEKVKGDCVTSRFQQTSTLSRGERNAHCGQQKGGEKTGA